MGADVVMTYKLSDNERTLLSAYMDGELLPEELREAEQLLARSGDASAYLKELRAVHALSGGTLAASCVVDGTSTMLAAKLSGKAIEAAAGRAVLAKTTMAGTWGVAGVVGTVAAVVAGIVLWAGSPDPGSSGDVAGKRPGATVQTMMQPQAQQSIAMDTSSLLVPPMTPSDLLTFAVDGTLPIDTKGGRYITMGPSNGHALSVEMHDKTPRNLAEQLPSLDGSALAILDSIQRVVRTSLLQCSNERIALRTDMPSLRLGVIRSLEKAAPHLPSQLREQLDRSRTVLMAAESANNATGSRAGAGAGGLKKSVPYMVVQMEGVGARAVQVPFPFADDEAMFGQAMPPVMIDPGELFLLQQRMPVPPDPPFFEEEEAVLVNSNPSGVRIQRTSPRRRSSIAISSAGGSNALNIEVVPHQGYEEGKDLPMWIGGSGLMQLGMLNDSVMLRLQQSLLNADESVRRADSILRYVQEQLWKSSQMQKEDGTQQELENTGQIRQEIKVMQSNGTWETTVEESNP